ADAGLWSPGACLPRTQLWQERARSPDLEAHRPGAEARAVQARRGLLPGRLRPVRDADPQSCVGRTRVHADAEGARQPEPVVPADIREPLGPSPAPDDPE